MNWGGVVPDPSWVPMLWPMIAAELAYKTWKSIAKLTLFSVNPPCALQPMDTVCASLLYLIDAERTNRAPSPSLTCCCCCKSAHGPMIEKKLVGEMEAAQCVLVIVCKSISWLEPPTLEHIREPVEEIRQTSKYTLLDIYTFLSTNGNLIWMIWTQVTEIHIFCWLDNFWVIHVGRLTKTLEYGPPSQLFYSH